uniref:F-BAR domain-containing protein n=1 Tax=Biomphalaria glabrata TaxID=6526 RepID=A0A2C9KP48_BIOGL
MMKQMDSKSLELQKFRTAAELAKQKVTQLQKDFDEQVKKNEEIKTDMTKYLDRQISALQATHRQEMQDFKQLVEAEAKKLQIPFYIQIQSPGCCSFVTYLRTDIEESTWLQGGLGTRQLEITYKDSAIHI